MRNFKVESLERKLRRRSRGAMRPGKTEYAMGIAVMPGQVRRRERAVLVTVQAQFKSGQTLIGRCACRNTRKTKKSALKHDSINYDNADQPSPDACPSAAELTSRVVHGGKRNIKHGRHSSR